MNLHNIKTKTTKLVKEQQELLDGIIEYEQQLKQPAYAEIKQTIINKTVYLAGIKKEGQASVEQEEELSILHKLMDAFPDEIELKQTKLMPKDVSGHSV